jgi:hypothetical protein
MFRVQDFLNRLTRSRILPVAVAAPVLFVVFATGRSAHPEPPQVTTPPLELSPYGLEYRLVASTVWTELRISVPTDCAVLGDDLDKVCTLALFADPSVIGAHAEGRLNLAAPVETEAIAWRARLDRDPKACERGGLVDRLLTDCEDFAIDPGAGRIVGLSADVTLIQP